MLRAQSGLHIPLPLSEKPVRISAHQLGALRLKTTWLELRYTTNGFYLGGGRG